MKERKFQFFKLDICFAFTINVKMANFMLEFKEAIGKSDTSYFWLQSPKWPVLEEEAYYYQKKSESKVKIYKKESDDLP